MKHLYLWTVLACASLLCACGGGGSSSSSNNGSGGTPSGNNVATVSVGPGPADPDDQTFNIPLTTMQICQAGTCATIANVLVDTGSSGVRLIASAAASAGLTLTPVQDPNNLSNTLYECLPFADGYSWGPVALATVTIGGETSKQAIPVQVIQDGSASPQAPSDCTSWGTSLDSVDAFDATGVIGVSVFSQDCGNVCAECPSLSGGCQGVTYDSSNNTESGNTIYYSCDSSGTCNATAAAIDAQVINPVTSFQTDNNGVILQLSSIPASGQASASGYLIFGIGTESNNALSGATVLTADEDGNFTTVFYGNTLGNSFLDSGSNSLFFPQPTPALATCGTSGIAAEFYCPDPTADLSATNEGNGAVGVANGSPGTVSFQVADLNNISNAEWAIDDVGGTSAASAALADYFDWGIPFFYGRSVYTAIEGATVAGTTYDNGFYAY